MYTLSVLDSSKASSYENLTFPLYRNILYDLDNNKSMIAIAASNNEQPLGLAIAEIRPQDRSAQVHSIFVEPSHRSHGIGTALLTNLQVEIGCRAGRTVEMVYTIGKPTTPALERLLQKCQWTSPQPRMLLCNGSVEKVMEASWMKKYSQLSEDYTIFPWTEITEQERNMIKNLQQEQSWIPEDLIPFNHEKGLEPLNSLGLRYQGQVVGWVINHRLYPDTIRYTCSFVRKDLQKMGRIISLYAEAAKLQMQAKILRGIWTVPMEHESMVKFVRQRWMPYLDSVVETKGSQKFIA
jgi:GNAT superfamily N-acetyltransferase